MSRLTQAANLPIPEGTLFERIDYLIEQGQRTAAQSVNAALTLTYWRVGHEIRREVLREQRADYGKQIVITLSRQLVAKRGRSYDEKNLRRMMQFAEQYPDERIVVSLGRQLSWTHFRALLPIKDDSARHFYEQQVIDRRLSVRDLRRAIDRKAYERREIANSQIPPGSATPRDTFTDPMILDMLGLHDGYVERDLEAAILHDMRDFLMEVGQGFTFVASQKRMPVAGDTEYILDLLFFSRPLRRLVAVELKLGKFTPACMGQMEAYLKWLDKFERREGEEAPIGLILCSAANRDEIEFLELHKGRIVVAEYWTLLPPKAELEAKLRQIVSDAQERLARRGITAEFEDVEEDDE